MVLKFFFKKKNEIATETEIDIVLEYICRLILTLQQRHDEIILEYLFKIGNELAAKTENDIVSE